jgi:hypothetical protein
MKGNIMPPRPIAALGNALQALGEVNQYNSFYNVTNPQVKQATTGGFRIKAPGSRGKIFYGVKLNDIFVAKGLGYNGMGIPAQASFATDGAPRLHSEVAFLQHLTSTPRPDNFFLELGNDDKPNSILETALQTAFQKAGLPKNNLRLKIEMQNSGLPPCVNQEYPGIPCDPYIERVRRSLQNLSGINDVRIKVAHHEDATYGVSPGVTRYGYGIDRNGQNRDGRNGKPQKDPTWWQR